MNERWRSVPEGPAVVAERDQFEADLRDRVRDACLVFCVTMDAGCELAVRCLFGLEDEPGADARVEASTLFLLRARDSIDELIDQLGGML